MSIATTEIFCAEVDPRTTGPAQVYEDYVRRNIPCVIRGLVDVLDWRARESLGSLEAVATAFAGRTVPVVETTTYADWRRPRIPIEEFVEEMQRRPLYLKDCHVLRELGDSGLFTSPPPFADDWLNWFWDHRVGNLDLDSSTITTRASTLTSTSTMTSTSTTASHDFSCEALGRARDDDFRFLYVGSPGTWTPLHSDVLGSHSWSANLSGSKAWLLFSPAATPSLLDPTTRDLIADPRTSCDWERLAGESLPPKAWQPPPPLPPSWDADHGDGWHLPAGRCLCLQEPGDVIFVPGGWHHAVYNLACKSARDCSAIISVNCNWISSAGGGLLRLWVTVRAEVEEARRRIADVLEPGQRSLASDSAAAGSVVSDIDWEFEWQCQAIARASCGMDMVDVGRLVALRARHVQEQQQLSPSPDAADSWTEAGSRLEAATRADIAAAVEAVLTEMRSDLFVEWWSRVGETCRDLCGDVRECPPAQGDDDSDSSMRRAWAGVSPRFGCRVVSPCAAWSFRVRE